MGFEKIGKPKRAPLKEPARGLMSEVTGLKDGVTVRHKFRRGVTGVVRLVRGDWYVDWSDGSTQERLDVADVALKPRR